MALGVTHGGGGCGSLATLTFWEALDPDTGTDVPSGTAYLDAVFALFEDFLQMQRDGVFLLPEEIDTLTRLGIVISNDFRGSSPPGGFFARPPGSDWSARIGRLDDDAYADQDHCVVIPKNAETDDIVCGGELALLIPAVVFDPPAVERITNRMWLAKICHESPSACPLRSDY